MILGRGRQRLHSTGASCDVKSSRQNECTLADRARLAYLAIQPSDLCVGGTARRLRVFRLGESKMPLFELSSTAITGLQRAEFAALGVLERGDLQRLLRD